MICSAEASGWAGRIIYEIGDTSLSTGIVVSWLQNSLYKLNIALGSSFLMSGECIVPDMSQIQSGIYEQMYYCDYLKKKSLSPLVAVTSDWVEIEGDKQGRIRRSSKSELSKTYLGLSKDVCADLDKLISDYLYNWVGVPQQVLYNDRCDPPADGLKNYCHDRT